MLKKILAGIGVSVMGATLMYAQGAAAPQGAPAPQQPAAGAPQGGGGGRGARGAGGAGAGAGGAAAAAADPAAAGAAAGRGGRGAGAPPPGTWANPTPDAKKWIEEAKKIAGNDPDLQFDAAIFCQEGRGASGPNRATVGVPNSEPKLTPFPAPNPSQVLGLQRLFDNFYWVGNTGIGAWIITSDDGYIVYDAMNNTADARDIIVPAMQKAGLDPTKIKYLVFGHNHGDHTGGGRYLQKISGAKAVQHWSDWEIYLRSKTQAAANAAGRGAGGAARGAGAGAAAGAAPAAGAGRAGAGAPAPAAGAAAAPAAGEQAAAAGARGGGGGGRGNTPPDPDDLIPMTRDIDATDGMEITIGNRQKVTATLYMMSAHTPGSMAMIVPVRYENREHPILIVTAGNAFDNINAYIGAYEYVFGVGVKRKVESVMQAHPNTNMNLLARTKYVNDNYGKIPKNPLLYGAERTAKYLEIVKACSRAYIYNEGMMQGTL